MNLSDAVWTEHGREQANRRGIDPATVESKLRSPDSVRTIRVGRIVVHSRFQTRGSEFLLRIFVDVDREPPEIVTVYRTSKIEKYEDRE